jgi:hypothetical protein
MNKDILINDLMSLEEYSKNRSEFRKGILLHKQYRNLQIGEAVTLFFEDRRTILYQIQEMLRIEKIFEEEGIREELSSYNPLIPNGDNWKATMMIQYTDPQERQIALSKMVGIEDCVWVKVGDNELIYAVADEDLDRTREDKTSSVHFLRFQFDSDILDEINETASIVFGIDHKHYDTNTGDIEGKLKTSIVNDLD